jgi:hypothetical protein
MVGLLCGNNVLALPPHDVSKSHPAENKGKIMLPIAELKKNATWLEYFEKSSSTCVGSDQRHNEGEGVRAWGINIKTSRF